MSPLQDDLREIADVLETDSHYSGSEESKRRAGYAAKLREHAAAMDAASPVGHVDVEPAKGWPDRRIGILHRDVPVGTSLYTHPAPPASEVVEAVEKWLNKYTPTDDFGCACSPNRTCGTCQWRNRTAELRAAIHAGDKPNG